MAASHLRIFAAVAGGGLAACYGYSRGQTTAPKVRTIYDVAVVGGGIVGLSVARECAVRGATVVLFEREDAIAGP